LPSNKARQFLERGVVVFEHLFTGSVDTLAPSDQLIASATKLTVGPAQYAGATSTDWLKKTLMFGERPPPLILAEMEHHFGMTVLLPDSMKSVTLSGQIELSSPGESLSDLGTALGGRFDESRPNVFLFSVE
jgi:ferric-dicitrate binding protein FerR (iron transport regulator)